MTETREEAVSLVARPLFPDRDLERVLALYARHFGKELDERRWSWKYLPPWAERPRAWVVEAGDRIVGHLGAVPLRGKVEREEVMFFQIGDIVVDPEFRSMDVYAALEPTQFLPELARDHPRGIVYGFSGEAVGSWYRWFSASAPVTHVESAQDRIIRPLRSAGSAGIELVPWHWDSPELDAVWAGQRGSVRAGLVRDRAYLEWRYAGHPAYPYSLLGVLHRGRPVGWIVTTPKKQASSRELELRVQDLLLPPALRIPALRQAAAAHDADAVVCWLPENAVAAGIESRANGWQVMHLPLSPSVSREFLARNVFYTLGEADQWWW